MNNKNPELVLYLPTFASDETNIQSAIIGNVENFYIYLLQQNFNDVIVSENMLLYCTVRCRTLCPRYDRKALNHLLVRDRDL